jgi:hypothetical protein
VLRPITKFTEIHGLFTNLTKMPKNLEKSPETLGTTGGDTRWIKTLEKPNCYVKENPEVSIL